MKIESLIKRPNGTTVNLEGPEREYHFKPSLEDSRHIADVDIESHAKLLLKIKEGFSAVDDVKFDLDEGDTDQGRKLKTSVLFNPEYKIKGGDTVSLEDLTNMAFDDSNLTEEEWNNLDDQEVESRLNTILSEIKEDEPEPEQQAEAQTPAADQAENKDQNNNGIDDNLENLSREQLVAMYVDKFGRKPSSQMKDENLRRALNEDED